jgi:hypothetical protein
MRWTPGWMKLPDRRWLRRRCTETGFDHNPVLLIRRPLAVYPACMTDAPLYYKMWSAPRRCPGLTPEIRKQLQEAVEAGLKAGTLSAARAAEIKAAWPEAFADPTSP